MPSPFSTCTFALLMVFLCAICGISTVSAQDLDVESGSDSPASRTSGGDAQGWEGLTIHGKPASLHPNARTEDWPRFLGPRDNASCRESHLDLHWPSTGPRLIWECEKGDGYTAPSIADGRLFYFHRPQKDEVVECLDPETGKRFWQFSYPIEYQDLFGYSSGPRASPVIDGDRVYTLGVTSILHCLHASDGQLLWKKDLAKEYQVLQNFFGAGPSPLVWKDLLIQNIGGKAEPEPEPEKGACVGAFDKLTGAEKWILRHRWGASYASPVMTRVHDRDVLLVLAGGKSRPAHGGLLLIDPLTGEFLDEFAWRADKFESVNASTPLVLPGNRVFISETYKKGGVLLEITKDFKLKTVWQAPKFGMHWMTPLFVDSHLYGYAGRNEPDAFLACYSSETGGEVWRDETQWKANIPDRRGRDRNFSWSFFRGSLLQIAPGQALALGELGNLALLDLSPTGMTIHQRISLFRAQQTWTLPVISRGLLYIVQNEKCMETGKLPRILCYDLRASSTAEE